MPEVVSNRARRSGAFFTDFPYVPSSQLFLFDMSSPRSGRAAPCGAGTIPARYRTRPDFEVGEARVGCTPEGEGGLQDCSIRPHGGGVSWEDLEAGHAGSGKEDTVSSALARLLAVEPGERAALRLVGALADALPALSCAALVLEGEGGRLEVAAGVGLDDTAGTSGGPLAAEALAAGTVRLAPDPGPPFPAGTRAGAGAAFAVGETRGAILAGTREAGLDAATLLVLRAAADRAGLLAERERLVRGTREASDRARRVEEESERRRHAVDTILGVVGHDLRNPLGAIHMSAALLQKRGALEGWQARTVERIRSSTGRMARIIADLLSYTRTRLGGGIPIRRGDADLVALVGRVVDELRAGNPGREISVEAHAPDLVGSWDPDRLEQVASNLVSNAVDHGDPGTPVRVELEADPAWATLTVRNHGNVPPPEALVHLFEPFSQSPDEQSRKGSGLGLGLYIAREIVRGHGGEITARVEGTEMVVVVRLPRAAGAGPDAH
jgi:signal transduction histidine kinase